MTLAVIAKERDKVILVHRGKICGIVDDDFGQEEEEQQ